MHIQTILKKFLNIKKILIPTMLLMGLVLTCIADAAYSLPEVQELSSKNGSKLLYVKTNDPYAYINLAFRGAGVRSDSLSPEIESLMLENIFQGEFASRKHEFKQAGIREASIAFDNDNFYVSFNCHANKIDKALSAIGQALLIDQNKLKKNSINTIENNVKEQLNFTASGFDVGKRQLYTVFFSGHDYEQSFLTLKRKPSLTANDLYHSFRTKFCQDNLIISAAATMEQMQLLHSIEFAFKSFTAKNQIKPCRKIEAKGTGEIIRMPAPMPQSTVVFGQKGKSPKDTDYYSLTLLNNIVGNGVTMNSRLFKDIRENKGLVYQINSEIQPLENSSLMVGLLTTEHHNVNETIRSIRNIWSEVKNKGITAEELKKAKAMALVQFFNNLTHSKKLASVVLNHYLFANDANFINKFQGNIEAVSLENINRVAKEIYNPKELTFVTLGESKA